MDTRVHDELELKARVADPERVERAVIASGAAPVFQGTMIDRRYDQAGRLLARDEVLRLRVYRSDAGVVTGVLGWKGPGSVRDGYKHREERETTVADPDGMHAILERLGYEVVMRIDRRIAEYRVQEAAVRIERYPAMDVLVEVEGVPAAIERAIAATGLGRDAFLPEALPYFMADYERRTGRRARIAE